MDLADLTTGMRKNDFLEPEQLFFAKPGLSEFHESSAEKNNFLEPEKMFFLQRQACLNFIRLVCNKHFFRVWNIVFLQSWAYLSFVRGHATKKMNRKGELQTSRISSNLKNWQSYSRVPQILKVLCVWYSWKYVAHFGFEPLKFLYSEFLYNAPAVVGIKLIYSLLIIRVKEF